MGVKIFELLTKKEIGLKDLSNKVIMVDASLVLYQFLSSIRQRDGTPLKDSQGNVTSHLIGLFSRTTRLMQNHIKIAYVFDGKAPDLKKKERERRAGLKQEAKVKYEAALKAKDVAGMKKYDKIISIDNKKDMIEDGEHFTLLISVFEWDEKVKWHYDRKEKFIEGTIHSGDFLINIKAYYREPGTRVIRKLKIDCPSLRKLNKWF